MKRAFILLVTIISLSLGSEAQTIDEAFLYSRSYYSGTARFQAMGGAFTSLGGDLSVLGLNPAGLGVFRGMEISFTPQMNFTNSTTDFRLQGGTDSFYSLNLGQFGVVLPLISKESAGLKSLNVGYSYNNTNNYGANTLIKGTSSNSSMADYWALEANASNSEPDFLGDNEWMAFMGYIIDTIPGTGNYDYATIFSDFGNNANSTYGQTIRRVITKEGRAGEHSFSAAGNIDDKFYFGATIGISKISHESKYTHLEYDENNSIPLFNDFTFTDVVSTEGSGFSLKIGAIYRPISTVRIGFSFHSPTVYRLHEYYYSSLTANTDFDNYEFSFEPYRFSYTLTTPMRINTGVSLQVGKLGIVSADYEYLNHSTARFSMADDDYDYSVENEDIKNIFSSAHNIRLGAELRLNSMFYVRGGYSFYGSGFAVGEDNQDSNHSVYAAGFGVRQRNFFFDLAYSVRQNNQTYFMYGYQDVDPVDITYNRNTISATLGFKF